MRIQHKISVLFIIAAAQISFAQKKDENIGTEVVNVVKPYAPTISDAFKIKETPVLEDEETSNKEVIEYNIFSFPVASTFTPAKGKAAAVDKTIREKMYNNYATLGFGNYASAIAELFITENINNTDFVAGKLKHQSSQGNIKGVELDDKFYDTSLDLMYGSRTRNVSWKAEAGYQHQVYNWYGLPDFFGNNLLPEDRSRLLGSIDPQQTYHNFYLGGSLSMNESFFDKASFRYNRFWDAYGSEENRFYFKPSIKLDIAENTIKTNFTIDYLSSKFENSLPLDIDNPSVEKLGMENSYLILTANPGFQLIKDDLTLNIGAEVTFLSTLQNKIYGQKGDTDSDLFFYPKITASLRVVGDLMVAYAGAEGGLKQNSYRDFTNINPFLSPNQIITPTDSQYDVYVGLRGKLSNTVSYNVKGSYLSEKNKAFFMSNEYSQNEMNPDYLFGNSFQAVYDDVKTIGFFGEIKADLSKNIIFGINGSFSSYSMNNLDEAWNLPELKAGATLDVNITKKWFAGANVFFVGERMDYQVDQSFTVIGENKHTLDGYFDANFNLGYKHNERLTAFLRANNIANQAYERWLNFPVQQFQLLLGANYKFDL